MQTRPFVPERDAELLFDVYASTRKEEVAGWGLPEHELNVLLRMQHRCQLASYARDFPAPSLERSIVLRDGREAGYLCVHRAPGRWALVDIALLPEFRSLGTGGALIRGLQRNAAACGAQLRLHVRPDNRARRLYERLGFEVAAQTEVAIAMTWSTNTAPAPSTHVVGAGARKEGHSGGTVSR
jgi:ribosomal protein S18 acetylase RimI-like enzyme